MKNKKKLIVFNWKMQPQSLREAQALAQVIGDRLKMKGNNEIVIAPPNIYLSDLAGLTSKTRGKLAAPAVAKGFGGLRFASQNCFWENPPAGGGAYTGEISPVMLKNLGVEYVLIGHSERRQYLNETDEMINKKVLAALKAGLKVILCVGENSVIRKRGKKAVEKFIKQQLQKDLFGLKQFNNSTIQQLAIAYEPIWALSTTKNNHKETPQDAIEMAKYIKKILNSQFSILNFRVLYGGSVDSKNILDFIKHHEIDGVLVGGASVKIKEIKEIIKICR